MQKSGSLQEYEAQTFVFSHMMQTCKCKLSLDRGSCFEGTQAAASGGKEIRNDKIAKNSESQVILNRKLWR